MKAPFAPALALLALVAGCAGGNTKVRNDPALAPVYAGTIGLAVCGAEPCTLQLEPTLNLGAVGGEVAVVDVNNRALYRGTFHGALAGARISGNAVLAGLDGTLSLTLDAAGTNLNGAFVFTPTVGPAESGPLETADARTKTFDPKGTWTGFVEFSENLDLFDAALVVKSPTSGISTGTATWIGAGGDPGLAFALRAQTGSAVFRDPVTGVAYLTEIVSGLGVANLRLVVLEPTGEWAAFDVVREEP